MVIKKTEVKEEFKSKIERVEEDFEMPEMDRDPNQSQYKEVFFVKPIVKDAGFFQISKKVGSKYLISPRTDCNSVGGELKKIEMSSYTLQNEEKKTVKFHIVRTIGEDKFLYILSSAYTRPFIDVINCILDVNKPIERIHITLTYKDKYANATVSINGEAAKWKTNTSGPGKYSKDELKEYVIPILHPKTKVLIATDKSKLEEFLEDELRTHISVILPNSEHINFVSEDANKVLGSETDPTKDPSTFGDNEDEMDEYLKSLGEEN